MAPDTKQIRTEFSGDHWTFSVDASQTTSKVWYGFNTGGARGSLLMPAADARALGEALIAAADAVSGPVVLQETA